MYSFLHNLLSDKKGGDIFTLFGGWHFFYIALTLATIVTVLLFLKNKSDHAKEKTTQVFAHIAFGLYIADFFLMPLAYGEIDIEKLPFHACTAMCVLCFLSYHNRFLEKYRASFVLLGFISNLVYLIYPAGVMWHSVDPLSYRVIQTLTFHSIMTIYGSLTLVCEHDKFDLKKSYRDLIVVIFMTLWAMVGNYAYNGVSDGYSHFFNWFFVVRDPFYIIPESIAPFIMPFLNVAIFFAVEIIVHLILWAVKRKNDRGIYDTEKEYSILFIGNSYTFYNDMPTAIFEELAEAAGYRVKVEAITNGGHTLSKFADPTDEYGAKVEKELSGAKKYDFVVLQEQSIRPAAENAANFYMAVRDLSAKIREIGAMPVLYATWGRKTGSDTLTTYGWTNETMTYKLATSYQTIGDELMVSVAHVGLAFYDVYCNQADIELYDPDKSHPSYSGSYLAAATLLAKIFNTDPTKIEHRGSLSPAHAKILCEAARKAAFEVHQF